jgi:hypothetical protein
MSHTIDELIAEFAAALSHAEACKVMFEAAQKTMIEAVERSNKAQVALNDHIQDQINKLNGPKH